VFRQCNADTVLSKAMHLLAESAVVSGTDVDACGEVAADV
jgi:hypothetical protein